VRTGDRIPSTSQTAASDLEVSDDELAAPRRGRAKSDAAWQATGRKRNVSDCAPGLCRAHHQRRARRACAK